MLVAVLVGSVLIVVVLVVWLKMNAALALLLASLGASLAGGIPPTEIVRTIQEGLGSTLGVLALVIGLGAVLGKLLESSGGAEQLAHSVVGALGSRNAVVAASLLGLLIGIPVVVAVGFVIAVPLAVVIAKMAKMPVAQIGIPMTVSLMSVHSLVPPHPATTAVAVELGADMGITVGLGLAMALACSIVGGPIWLLTRSRGSLSEFAFTGTEAGSKAGNGVSPHYEGQKRLETRVRKPESQTRVPSAFRSAGVLLLPLFLIVGRTIAALLFEQDSFIRRLAEFVGEPVIALLIAVLVGYWALGLRLGIGVARLNRLTSKSMQPVGEVLLIIGAGGAFNAVLARSGASAALAGTLSAVAISPLVVAWLLALLMHFAVGSATVSIMSTAGVCAPLLVGDPSLAPELMVLAIAAGAIGMTHVTDVVFWMAKDSFNLTLGQSLRLITGGTTVAAVTGLILVLMLSHVM